MVKRFIKKDLICRYGLLAKLIADNAQNFNEKIIVKLYTKCKIKHFNSSLTYTQDEWWCRGSQQKSEKDHLENDSHLQWLARDASIRTLRILTTVRTSTSATLYFLVYGMKAMIPLKVEILSLWVLNDAELEESEYADLKFE